MEETLSSNKSGDFHVKTNSSGEKPDNAQDANVFIV